MPVLPYREFQPELGASVLVADSAVVVGKVRVAGPARFDASAVARGDQNWISIGSRFRLGQRSTMHVENHTATIVGDDVWVGDDAVVHACTLGDGVRVENGGLVISTSRVGAGSIVASDTLITEGAEFPENSYISGSPGRRIRDTSPEEREETRRMVASAFGG